MSEAESPEADTETETISSTKTVVVAPDVHKAIRHIATDRDQAIKKTVDELLRNIDSVGERIDD